MAKDRDKSTDKDKDHKVKTNNICKILDPCLDVVSKMLLGAPECRDGLIDLITCIITPPSPIVSLDVLNPIVPKELVDERGVELDLLLRLDDGSHVNLEMQTSISKILPHRALYHWSKVYSAQLKVGDRHPALRAVRSIFLLKHPLYTSDPNVAHHIIRAYREPLMVPATDHFRLDFVELPKLASTSPGQPSQNGRLRLWSQFFMNATQPDAIEALMSDPIIKKTFDKLKDISAMDEAQQIARARELGILRISMELDEARDEGLQKGLDEGEKRGEKRGEKKAQAVIVRKLMDSGMSLDQIATVLKMAKEQLESLLSEDQG